MRILMVLDREFPYDERVEKEALSLIGEGHEVHIASYCFTESLGYELYQGIHVHRRKIGKLMFKFSAASLLLPFYFWFWKRFVKSLFKNNRFDIIHVHDLPLASVGYKFKKKYRIPLICDQHEYYSNWIVHTAHYNRGMGKWISRFSNWQSYEKKYLHRADLVLTVEEPLREVYISEVGLPTEQVIAVPNTPDLTVFRRDLSEYPLSPRAQKAFKLVYAGGLDSLRGLEMVLDAMQILRDQIPDVLFMVAGKAQRGFDLNRLARERNLEDQLLFEGWLGKEELAAFFKAGQIGIFTPGLNREEIHRTIATKIYQYCAAGLPVMVTRARLMEEFTEVNRVGYAIDDATDLAARILELYKDTNLYREFSQNAREIADRYDWSRTVQPLLHAYTKLKNQYR